MLTNPKPFFVFITLIFLQSELTGQNLIIVSGVIFDLDDNRPLEGVNITVIGKELGSSSNSRGEFSLRIDENPPITLRFSIIGYEEKNLTISRSRVEELKVLMVRKIMETEKIDVIAPMIEQNIMGSPLSIEILHPLDVTASPALDHYDALVNIKDIDVATQSMGFSSYNARGFNMSGNTRFLQLLDGMDVRAAGWNFPVGNMVGLIDLDLARIEFLPGPQSALYGSGALNGVLFFQSKDPFLDQGLQVSVKSGINQIDLGPYALYQTAIHFSKALNERIAFKINSLYLRAKDWYAFDYDNVRLGSNPEQAWYEDPGYNGLNMYGDEIMAELPIGTQGRNVIIARSGYYEKDLADYGIYNFKLNSALHMRLSRSLTAILQGHLGMGTTVYTGDSRISLVNFKHVQAKAELNSDDLLLRGYINQQFSGDSYDSQYLAININRAWKSDGDWFYDYYLAYAGFLNYLGIAGGDHSIARKYANGVGINPYNQVRFEAGSLEFEKERERIKNTVGFLEGAKIDDNTKFYHLDGIYRIAYLSHLVDFNIGGSYRFYDLNSNGSIFPDTCGNDISNYEFGLFAQLSKQLFEGGLKLRAAVRYDKNENFEGNFSPSFSVLISISKGHNIRAAYHGGFRFPTVREQFINQIIGAARLVGGISGLLTPLALPNNSFFEKDVEKFREAVDQETDIDNPDRLGTHQAMIKNLSLLEQAIITDGQIKEILPEKVQSFEVGYRCYLSKRFYFDINYYRSNYQNFIGIIRIIKPRTSPTIDIYASARQMLNSAQRDVLHIYNNAQEEILTNGISLNLKYNFYTAYLLGANASWAEIEVDPNDPLVPGYNTPRYKVNISLTNRNVYKNFGFSVVWRWQDIFFWESSFADGPVPAYDTLDAQLSYNFEACNTQLKIGGTNILNQYYYNIYGGPKLGALYYVSLVMDSVL
jgi:outer membrane receptor protein involved in Fe transport